MTLYALKEISDVQIDLSGSQLYVENYSQIGSFAVAVEHLGNRSLRGVVFAF